MMTVAAPFDDDHDDDQLPDSISRTLIFFFVLLGLAVFVC